MEAVNTVVGLWINCLHHKSIITVVVVVGVLEEYFQFSTAKCNSTGAQYVTLKKENEMKKS
jgi:CTP:phosphocholine cytidylyltransferase-like protein